MEKIESVTRKLRRILAELAALASLRDISDRRSDAETGVGSTYGDYPPFLISDNYVLTGETRPGRIGGKII